MPEVQRTQLREEIERLMRDLAYVRTLPMDDPDRTAWLEQKRSIIERLERLEHRY